MMPIVEQAFNKVELTARAIHGQLHTNGGAMPLVAR